MWRFVVATNTVERLVYVEYLMKKESKSPMRVGVGSNYAVNNELILDFQAFPTRDNGWVFAKYCAS